MRLRRGVAALALSLAAAGMLLGQFYPGLAAAYAPHAPSVAGRIANGGFELGVDNSWTRYTTSIWSLIVTSEVMQGTPAGAPHSGAWAAWLGGGDRLTTALAQDIFVFGTEPILSFWYWIASLDECGHDVARILIDGQEVDRLDLCAAKASSTWIRRDIDLSALAGDTLTLRIEVTTDTAKLSSFFLDDVALGGRIRAYLPMVH